MSDPLIAAIHAARISLLFSGSSADEALSGLKVVRSPNQYPALEVVAMELRFNPEAVKSMTSQELRDGLRAIFRDLTI